MRTIRLQIKDHAYAKVLEVLKQFDSEDVSMSSENEAQTRIKAEMDAELEKIRNGTAKLMDYETFSQELEVILNEYEDKND